MHRAIELARRADNRTRDNPRVGCVIVHRGRIIGEGYHRIYGQAHAEVNAIEAIPQKERDLLPHSTLYVTLEPCHHQGKTPPCVDLIIERHIPQVVIGTTDPNPLTAGKSIDKLRRAGVHVRVGMLEEACQVLIRRFRSAMLHKRPYVLLKWAQSNDGYIGKSEEQVWLTGKQARLITHRMRTREGAILIGTRTAAIDDPRLTARYWQGPSPHRLTIDRRGVLPSTLRIFDKAAPTTVFVGEQVDRSRYPAHVHTRVLVPGQSLLEQVADYLHRQRIKSLIVEGGRQLLQAYIDAGAWDEARIFTATRRALGSGVAAPILRHGIEVARHTVGHDRVSHLRRVGA